MAQPMPQGAGPAWRTGPERTGRYVLGILALGSGAALITYIVAGISLVVGFAFAVLLQVAGSAIVWLRASPSKRRHLSRIALVGLSSGVLASAMYDLTKFLLSHFDSMVYNPFDVIRTFGVALLGASAPPMSAYSAGATFHMFNGVMFGLGFAFLFGRRGVLAGIAWGFFLEAFQLALFPGWLHIKAFQEFAQVSALSHVVYGAVLGLLCSHWLYRKALLQ
jgi:hypothetical protein